MNRGAKQLPQGQTAAAYAAKPSGPDGPRPAVEGQRATGLVHKFAHPAHGTFKSDENRLADQVMADVQLGELRDGRDRLDILIGQPVARVGFDPVLCRQRRHVGNTLQLAGAFLADGMGVFAGVEFHHRDAQTQGGLKLPFLRLDEQRHTNARIGKPRHDGRQPVVLARRVEPAFGGLFGAFLGHDAGRVRLVPECYFQHFRGRRHLEIERRAGFNANPFAILVSDMAAVFAQMRGDAVGARRHREFGGANRVGIDAGAGIAKGRDMIDIHAKT